MRIEIILRLISFVLSGYCSYETIIVLRRKRLTQSKRAIFLLKTCLCAATVTIVLSIVWSEYLEFPFVYVEVFGSYSSVPLVDLVGAINAHKIIEQRNPFVKLSSFDDDGI